VCVLGVDINNMKVRKMGEDIKEQS